MVFATGHRVSLEIRDSLRALGGNRFTVRERKEAGLEVGEAGGCLLSVDLSQAFDRVNRAKLDRALSEHQVGSNLRSTITAIHEEAAYQVRDRYHATKITTTQGIRQGCRLAPALWAILSSQVLWDLTPAGSTPMQLPWTLFADDHLGHWTLRTIHDGGRHLRGPPVVGTSQAKCGLHVVSSDTSDCGLCLSQQCKPECLADPTA